MLALRLRSGPVAVVCLLIAKAASAVSVRLPHLPVMRWDEHDRLVARLVDAQQAETGAGGEYMDASLTVQSASSMQFARRPASAGCARTPTQLVMDLQAACRTYNILVDEDRRVAAALLMA